MASLRRRINLYNPLGADWLFGAMVLLCLPALLFTGFMPAWTPQVALLGLVLVFGLRWLAVGRLTGQGWVDGPLLLLLALLPLILWMSLDVAVSRPLTFAFVANIALFWAVANQRWLPRHSWLLLLAAVTIAVIVLLGTRFSTGKLPFIDRDIYELLPGGWHAFWDQDSFNPNLSGGLLAIFLMPALAMAVGAPRWQERDIAKLVAIFLTILLLLTQSRGALLAALAGLAAMTITANKRWLPVWLIVVVAGASTILVAGPTAFFETVLGRGDLFADSSLQARLDLWGRSLELISDYALTGVGLGMFEPALKEFHPPLTLSPTANFGHAHNIYLHIGAEMGVPALLAHLSVYAALLVGLGQKAAHHGPALALGLLGSLVVFLVHGMVDAIIASPQVALLVWGLLGLMLAAPYERRSRYYYYAFDPDND